MREPWETNRDMKTKPKAGFHYCHECDGALLADGEKCYRCGARDLKKKHRRRR